MTTPPVSGLKPPIARAMGASPNNSARGGAKLRARSSSAGRGPDKGLRARYWAYLFENLQRAVDEIYHTCETDESTLECKEAILILENYTREFTALINWIQLSKQLENTPPPDRPTYLAWEVRKSSLGRGAQARNFLGSRPVTTVQRSSPSLVSVAIQCGADDSGQACPDTVEKHPGPSTDVSGNVVCVPLPRTAAVPSCDVVLETTESTGSEKSASDDQGSTMQAKVATPPESAKGSVKEPAKTSSPVTTSHEGTKPVKTLPVTASTTQAPLGARLTTPRGTKLARPTAVEAKSKANAEQHRPMSYSSSLKGGPAAAQHGTTASARAMGVTASVARPSTAVHLPKTSVPSRGPSVASSTLLQRTTTPARTAVDAPPKPSENGKGGSTLSLSRSSSGRSWADKVKGPSAAEEGTLTKSASLDPMAVDLDDSEGWETVRRNKPRSRNSPPKKMLAHQATPGAAVGGVKRSPSAPVISAPAPFRVKTPRRSSAPLSSGPAPSSRPGRSRVEQQGPKSATSMPSLVPDRKQPPRDSAAREVGTQSRPGLGARSKSSLCPPTRPARLAEEPRTQGPLVQDDRKTLPVKEDPASATEGEPAVGKEEPAPLLQEDGTSQGGGSPLPVRG